MLEKGWIFKGGDLARFLTQNQGFKSYIRETLNLSMCVDSRTDTKKKKKSRIRETKHITDFRCLSRSEIGYPLFLKTSV